jgi:hypothetical protein
VSFFDDLKGKAEDIAEEHGDAIEGGLDKLADVIDDKTNHEHGEQIDSGVEKAKDFLEGLADNDDDNNNSAG